MIIHINRPRCYKYKDIYFDFKYGVYKLNKDGNPSARQPNERSKFWVTFNEWLALTEKQREKYRV